MANFQWVGGTGNTISKYDWNVASNWRTRIWNPSTGTFEWQVPSVCPGPEDIAGIGGVFSSSLTCYSPLFYGGFSGSVAGGGWLNSNLPSGGQTFNTAANSVKVELDPLGREYIAYPFPYLGGGITGPNYDWIITNEGWMNNGPTGNGGGLSGHQANIDISDSRTRTLKLKTKEFLGGLYNQDTVSKFEFVKNYSHVDGSTGPDSGTAGSGTAAIISNSFSAVNAGSLYVKGGAWADFAVYPDYTYGLSANPKTTIASAVCREVITRPHTFLFDSDVTAGKMEVADGNFYPTHNMRFLGTIDMLSVLTDAYPAGGITGTFGVNDSTLYLGTVTTFGSRFPFCPFTFGDYETKGTSKAGTILVQTSSQRSEGSIYPCPWSLEFAGNVLVNDVRCINSTISASSLIAPNAKVQIGTIFLDEGSLLDFGAYSPFDNWFIGSTNGAQGGIVFEDELSSVGGSKGLRLWATQTSLGGRVDNRLSTAIKNPGKYTLPNAPETA